MKIKKILCGIAICVLLVSTCLSVVACAPNAKNVAGEQVTEEEWRAAFERLTANDAEFTVEYYAKSSTVYNHKTMIHTTKWTANAIGNYTYVKNGSLESKIGYGNVSYSGDKKAAENTVGIKAGKTSVEEYSGTANGNTYVFKKNLNDEWERSEAYSGVLSGEFSYITYMASQYSYYEYSKEHKGYVVKGYEEGDALSVYKFKNAKLVAVYYFAEDYTEESDAQEYACIATKVEYHTTIIYSAKEIKLPTISQ